MLKKDILNRYRPLMENVLLLLHDFQNSSPQNYLSRQDLAMIADYLNTTYGSIYGIASYYTMFSLKPRGKHLIRVCRSPVCHLLGAGGILAALHNTLNIGLGQTTPDGCFTLESTECLGQCDQAPGLLVDRRFYGNLTVQKITRIVNDIRGQRSG